MGFIEENGMSFVEEFLIPWLAIESISADPSKDAECLEAHALLCDEFKKSGFTVETIELDQGHPLIYAEMHVDSSLPTVLIYGHYDVQPVKEPEKWIVDGKKIDGFTPEVFQGRLYARGATDDKGQVGCHALAMRYFAQKGFPCNVKFIIEGDEESGGSSIEEWVHNNAEKLSCDTLIVSDTETLVTGKPALTTSLKGNYIVTATAECMHHIIELVHNSHDPVRNKTLIPDFYDDVKDFKMGEGVEEIAGKIAECCGEFIRPEEGYSQLHHRSYRPTNSPLFLHFANLSPQCAGTSIKIICNGPKSALHSGKFGGPVIEPGMTLCHILHGLYEKGLEYSLDYFDYGSRVPSTSIQPHGECQITIVGNRAAFDDMLMNVCQDCNFDVRMFEVEELKDGAAYVSLYNHESQIPTAYLSFRLVANQNPQKLIDAFTSFAQGHGVSLEYQHSGPPFNADLDNPYVQAAIKGLSRGYGEDSIHFCAEGGSIPIVSTFSEALKVPIILAGFSSPFDNLHAPNESFLIEESLFNGARSSIAILEEIAKINQN